MSTCVVFGLVPALRATGAHPVEAMKSGGRGLSGSRERTTIHRLLVVTQIAVSLVLLAGALLFVRSFHNLTALDPGMRQRGIIDALVAVPGYQGPVERYEALLRQVLSDIRAIPGISGVATTSNVPLLGSSWTHGITIGTAQGSSKFAWVSPGYFRTMDIPLLAGRDIDETDTSTSRRVAVVNQMFVRTFLGGNDPIGRTLRTSPEPHYPATDYEIVGVIADTKYSAIREGTPPMAFAPAWQHPQLGPGAMFMIHSSLAPEVTMAAIKRTIAAKHTDAVLEMKVFETQIRDGLLRERLMAMLSGFFGLLAALLAMIGLYGLISYLVARRQNEIGIRLALGARPSEIVRMVVADAGRLVLVGLLVGVGLALVAGRSASATSLLFGLEAYDPPTIIAACLLLAIIAGVASLVPARRAARLDALVALRRE